MIRRAVTILVSWIAFAGLVLYVVSFVAPISVKVFSREFKPPEDVELRIAVGGCKVAYTSESVRRYPQDAVCFALVAIEHGPLRWTQTRNRSDFTYYHRNAATFPLSPILIVPWTIALFLAVRRVVRTTFSGRPRSVVPIGLGGWLLGGLLLAAIGSITTAWLSSDHPVDLDVMWWRQSVRHSAGLTFDRDIASLRLDTEAPYRTAPGWFPSATPQWATQFGVVSTRSYPVPAWAPPTLLAMLSVILLLLRPIRTWRRRRSGLCLQCGYDLTGLPEPRCPECGRGFDGDLREAGEKR